MRKLSAVALTICSALIWISCNAQRPGLSVQSFEWEWQQYPGKRVIIATDDSVKQAIEKSFGRAIQQRWNAEVHDLDLSVKPAPFSFSGSPKFKTKLKGAQPGTWYMFLQIMDMGNSLAYYHEDESLTTKLQLKCRLVNSGDSVILERTLLVNMYRETPPPDQVLLKLLPADPLSFVRALDSIATWLFQFQGAGEKDVWLKPACAFSQTKLEREPLMQLDFKSDKGSIHHLSQPSFLFRTSYPAYQKIDAKKNAGGNSASGALTLFTGIHLNKTRVYEYRADFSFEENDSTYHCFVNYSERETAEQKRGKVENSDGSKWYSLKSGEYTLEERRTSPDFLNAITLGNDTLATFGITYLPNTDESNNYTQRWDGSDSSTITALPQDWNNSKLNNNAELKGTIKGVTFLMKTFKESIAKEFYIDEQPVMIIYGGTTPGKAILFQPLSEQQLKLFTILSSLPYAYFNYEAE